MAHAVVTNTAGFHPCWYNILQEVQHMGIYKDCKTFVDMPVRRPWPEVEAKWMNLIRPIEREDLESFVSEFFDAPGSDLEEAVPDDWQDPGLDSKSPGNAKGKLFAARLFFKDSATQLHERYARFAAEVYGIWPKLCRKAAADVSVNPNRHTLLPLPHPFVIPGDRFRECYNWDTFWILRGLVACGMVDTAENLLHNLLFLTDRFGFVPNGARTYYTNRSQPPLLSAMVRVVAGARATAAGADASKATKAAVETPAEEAKEAETGGTVTRAEEAPEKAERADAGDKEDKRRLKEKDGQEKSKISHLSVATRKAEDEGGRRKGEEGAANEKKEGEREREKAHHSCETKNATAPPRPSSELLLCPNLLAAALPRLIQLHRYWTTGGKRVRVRARGALLVKEQENSGRNSVTNGDSNDNKEPRNGKNVPDVPDVRDDRGHLGHAQHVDCPRRTRKGSPYDDEDEDDDGGEGDDGGVVYELSRYFAALEGPRPESMREDTGIAEALGLRIPDPDFCRNPSDSKESKPESSCKLLARNVTGERDRGASGRRSESVDPESSSPNCVAATSSEGGGGLQGCPICLRGSGSVSVSGSLMFHAPENRRADRKNCRDNDNDTENSNRIVRENEIKTSSSPYSAREDPQRKDRGEPQQLLSDTSSCRDGNASMASPPPTGVPTSVLGEEATQSKKGVDCPMSGHVKPSIASSSAATSSGSRLNNNSTEAAKAAEDSGCCARHLFRDIASAAESGWDFSSRWFVGGSSLAHTATTRIIPADLNAWLLVLERDIADFAARGGDDATFRVYSNLANRRRRAINHLMWDEQAGCWRDLLIVGDSQLTPVHHDEEDNAVNNGENSMNDNGHKKEKKNDSNNSNERNQNVANTVDLASGDVHPCACRGWWANGETVYDVQQRLDGFYASSWVPLACGCAPYGGSRAKASVQGLINSGLIQEGGIMTSTVHTGEQWDAPNSWPPLTQIVVQALENSGVAGAEALAASVARRFVDTAMAAYHATGHMHEKYDAMEAGAVGHGGEYEPQLGFGWTNGVVLDLLNSYATTSFATASSCLTTRGE